MIEDRRISRKRKRKIFSSTITPAYIYGVESMALTEKQQEKVQVCEKYWVRIIVLFKRAGQRRMDELRAEVRVKERLKKKSVRSRLN